MFATSADILNMSLAIGFIVLVIFLCITLFYAILVLRDVSKTTTEVRDIIDKVHSAIMQPLNALEFIFDKAKPYVEMMMEKKTKKGAKK